MKDIKNDNTNKNLQDKMEDIIKYQIVPYLELKDVKNISTLNKNFNQYCKSESFWKILFSKYYGIFDDNYMEILYRFDSYQDVFKFVVSISISLDRINDLCQFNNKSPKDVSRVLSDFYGFVKHRNHLILHTVYTEGILTMFSGDNRTWFERRTELLSPEISCVIEKLQVLILELLPKIYKKPGHFKYSLTVEEIRQICWISAKITGRPVDKRLY